MKIKIYIALFSAVVLLNSLSFFVFAETSGNTAAEVTFESGTLTLAEMTSFGFGSHPISPAVKTYPALEGTVFLEVRDLRGTGDGWKVTVLASRFNPGEKPTLSGASISLINGVAVPASASGSGPSVNTNIKIECDGVASDNVALAVKDRGLGVWAVEWNGNINGNTNVTLNVPGGVATVGKHTANITWTLSNAP